MGEEVVLLDGHGTPVGPVISWFDRRGHDEARAFPATGLHERFQADPSWSLFKLLWLRRHRPAEVAATRTILDLGSFVLYSLGAPPIMDWSHASRTGLFDPVVRHWDVDTLVQAELQRSIWPELVPSGLVLGQIRPETAAEIGIDPAALLVSGGHDHFVGAYGCGVRGIGDAYLSAGTSEALLVLTDRVLEMRAGVDRGCYVDADHSYLHANTPGGHVYGQWRELLYPSTDEARVRAAVVAADVPGGVVDIDQATGAASLRGVPLTDGRAEVMRSVIEGAAILSSAVFDRLAAAAPNGISRLLVAGHAAGDPLWRSLRLGLFGIPMDVVEEREATAVGAALLARRAIAGEAPPFTPTQRFSPTQDDVQRAAQLRQRYEAGSLSGARS